MRFLIVGDGDHRDELRKQAAALGLTNVVFHGPVPKNQVLSYLAQSHVCVLCTWPHPFLGTVLQNKIFDYMASARPVVAAVHGELAQVIESADCGWVVSPGAPEELARICLELSATEPQVLQRKGANGRDFVERHYRRSRLADRALDAATSGMRRPAESPDHVPARTVTSPSSGARRHDGHDRSRRRSIRQPDLARSGPADGVRAGDRRGGCRSGGAVSDHEDHPWRHAGLLLGDAALPVRRTVRRPVRPAPPDVHPPPARNARHPGSQLADGLPDHLSRCRRRRRCPGLADRRLRAG